MTDTETDTTTTGATAAQTGPILELRGVNKAFHSWVGLKREAHQALDDVDLTLDRGEVLGIIGESGSGKSTLANIIMGLEQPDSGQMFFEGREIDAGSSQARRGIARDIQIVFQDPYSSLNPRMNVKTILREPLRHVEFGSPAARDERCVELLDLVGLPADALKKYPHEFSGGQRQRIAIARALALDPKILVCDEAVSALDVSIQAQILDLLMRLKHELRLTIVFIAHGLNAVERVSDHVMVMHNGRVVERGTAQQVLQTPQEEYTQQLVEISRDIVPFKFMK